MMTNNLFSALLKANTLANADTWKKVQNLINLMAGLTPLFTLLSPRYAQFLTPETLTALTLSVGAINTYLTTATTDKIGL